jgi:hypothetical protein
LATIEAVGWEAQSALIDGPRVTNQEGKVSENEINFK